MLTDNTYLQGLILNNEYDNNIGEANDYIYNMLGNCIDQLENGEYSKDNIVFLQDYRNIFFKTEIINGQEMIDRYSKLQFKEYNKKVRENIYIFHFFYEDNLNEDKLNQLTLYKYISNIENMIRLLIAFSYYISPNLPYPKKNNTVFDDDINKYYKKFLFKDEILDFNKFIQANKNEIDKIKRNKLISNWLDGIFDEYVKIENIKEKVTKFKDKKYLHYIRGAIAHNKIFKTYENNLNIEDILDYEKDIKDCKIKYSELNNLLEYLLKEYKIKK